MYQARIRNLETKLQDAERQLLRMPGDDWVLAWYLVNQIREEIEFLRKLTRTPRKLH